LKCENCQRETLVCYYCDQEIKGDYILYMPEYDTLGKMEMYFHHTNVKDCWKRFDT
jgi:hypothetical protein